ncbi:MULTISPECIES: ABC transporter ATP-binding protein/permease [Synechocystis]|uniref:ABC transporter ATP-binding protein/permease n=1 Tax=Synechocystis salina LEGE 00031 TaxID=1828736 RepID=A0ABR9VUL2_9SYNC|nr:MULTISPECIES: ABC transporter ATP-binding protein/permease [Synechocystis]MBE9194560.1 ABC transporter ATP-binding protein/permease [Synechocystis sp. LEGE 06083]MBE9241770.1 ABC transporter ATP-binding protein/permease [Synechocystis salina LEGE 00041]MBE9255055.1 ABC transporter ATP-binding protein/permease [Synechocystis salina LEGE 00031]
MTQAQAKRFQFDRQLWHRFVETAQPYFYPVGQKQTRVFLILILALMVVVVALTLFLSMGLTLWATAIFPDFFAKSGKGLVDGVQSLINSPAPWIGLGALAIAGAVFVSQRQKLQQRWLQWLLLGILLSLLFIVNGLNVILSFVFRFIDTALNGKDGEVFWQFLWIYGIVIVVAIPIIVAYRYLRQKLGVLWREWLTEHFLGRYFKGRSYYRLDSNSAYTLIDNPDQRITQDIQSFTGVTLDFLLDILDSILTLISFTAILYSISQTLMWGLIGYATFGTVAAIAIGTRLIRINYEQLRLEANFRYGLVRVRDNAESIAFYRGERLERKQVTERLLGAIRNFNLLIIWQALISLFQLGYNYFTRLIPYIIIAPLYLAGDLDFGAIAQASLAFGMVLSALSLVTNQIQNITEFAASINRLGEFYDALNGPGNDRESSSNAMVDHITTHLGPTVSLDNVTLSPPHSSRVLVRDLSLAVDTGNHLLIMGPSGSGKSSLLRAIAGLWDSGQGIIERPELADLLFLPQRPYMILGTLREQLIYPSSQSIADDDFLLGTLKRVNLSDLAERFGGLDSLENWSSVLSLGEQQRIALARVFINQPRYAILDEATSALDVDNEADLYHALTDLGTTFISVGHRPTLRNFHRQCLEVQAEGRWQLSSIQK